MASGGFRVRHLGRDHLLADAKLDDRESGLGQALGLARVRQGREQAEDQQRSCQPGEPGGQGGPHGAGYLSSPMRPTAQLTKDLALAFSACIPSTEPFSG